MSNTQRSGMIMVGFVQAQNCSNYAGSWRHPAAASDFLTPAHYQRIARVLEEGKFHLAFFDDRLAMPDIYGGDYRSAVLHGIRPVKMDLVPILTVMGLSTRYIGLGGTYSTTYYEPFHVARVFATLDLMIGGRAAWNVVTSLNDAEAANFGHEEHLAHDQRYERAHEFMEVVLGHWATWADDALKIDRDTGEFANPDKVRRLDHSGRYFKSRGPFTVPRSVQGHPVVMQAGQSGIGQKFAARWGELIFALYRTIDGAKKSYRDFKEEVGRAGRNPEEVKVAPAIYCVTGESRSIAKEKLELVESLLKPVDRLAVISDSTNVDFGKFPTNRPLSDAEIAEVSDKLGARNVPTKTPAGVNLTVDEFVKATGRGSVREVPLFVGTAKDIADEMEAWFVSEACDGFVLSATHRPGAYEDFVRLVVPELQRRKLYHSEYSGTTLRANLGLPIPKVMR